jgi:putative transposase
MKTSKFSDSQILAILKQAEAGAPVPELCREHGMNSATFCKWRARFGGMDASVMARLKELESENAQLKKMYAEERLKANILKEAIEKSGEAVAHAAGGHPVAAEALQRIARLYAIEEQAKVQTADQRAQSRALHSQPELQSLHDWLLKLRPNVASGGNLAKAIDYTLRRWPTLIHYAETGDLPIDNNPIENAIRPIAIGKRTGYLRAVNAPASVLPRSKVCWRPPN